METSPKYTERCYSATNISAISHVGLPLQQWCQCTLVLIQGTTDLRSRVRGEIIVNDVLTVKKALPDAWDRFLLDGRHFKRKGNWGVGPLQLSIDVVQCRRTGEHWRVALGQDKQKAYVIINSNYLWLTFPSVTSALQLGGFLLLEWTAVKGAYWVPPSRSYTRLEKLMWTLGLNLPVLNNRNKDGSLRYL